MGYIFDYSKLIINIHELYICGDVVIALVINL